MPHIPDKAGAAIEFPSGGKRLGERGELGRQHVVGRDLRKRREPEVRELREHDALARDAGVEDHVEGADAVARHNQQAAFACPVQVANLPPLDELFGK